MNHTVQFSVVLYSGVYMSHEPHFVQFSVLLYSGIYAAGTTLRSVHRGALQWSIYIYAA